MPLECEHSCNGSASFYAAQQAYGLQNPVVQVILRNVPKYFLSSGGEMKAVQPLKGSSQSYVLCLQNGFNIVLSFAFCLEILVIKFCTVILPQKRDTYCAT
jgi:hypothetical protein